jgi:hypothetical protein
MAVRLATEYKQMELDLSSQQLQEFMDRFKTNDFRTKARVFENGDTEFILFDEGTEIPLAFRNMGSFFKYEGSYTIKNWKLAHAIQKAVRDFEGHALVHRVYNKYVIEYQYEHGNVVQIKEFQDGKQRVIYQYNNQLDQLNHLLKQQVIEDQIGWVRLQVDMLLDQRLKVHKTDSYLIDKQLQKLTKELFILEA